MRVVSAHVTIFALLRAVPSLVDTFIIVKKYKVHKNPHLLQNVTLYVLTIDSQITPKMLDFKKWRRNYSLRRRRHMENLSST